MRKFGGEWMLPENNCMYKLFRAGMSFSEMRTAMPTTESWLKGLRNSDSSGFSLSKGVNNGSLNKFVPLLFSGWAEDVLSPLCCLPPAYFFEGIPEYIMCTCEMCSPFVFSHVIVHADSSNRNEIRKGFNKHTMWDCLISNEVWKIFDWINAFFETREYDGTKQNLTTLIECLVAILTLERLFACMNSQMGSENGCCLKVFSANVT